MSRAREILLSRMYSGDYLHNNIGHEAINLFRDDNNDNYIYITNKGTIGKSHDANSITDILLVGFVSHKCMRVIAKATELIPLVDFSKSDFKLKDKNPEYIRNIEYIKKNNVCYSGIRLDKIYEKNPDDKNRGAVLLTYKTGKILYPKEPLYIHVGKYLFEDVNSINLGNINFPTMSLHWTYNEYEEPYGILRKVINDKKLWVIENLTQKIPCEFDINSLYENLLLSVGDVINDCLFFDKVYKDFLDSIKRIKDSK